MQTMSLHSLDLRAFFDNPHFRRGARDMIGVAPGIAAWGLVTGVAMVKTGLSVPMALLMTATVYAGSAQFASLPLLAAGAPMWVICAAAFCVNLRFLIYSAQWRVFFEHLPRWQRVTLGYFSADLNLVVFQKAYPHAVAERGQVAYFLGVTIPIWFAWQVPSVVGIFLADAIPASWGLDFAGTLAMLGITYSLLTDRSTWAAAVVAGVVAVLTFALPLKLNIVLAIFGAVAAGLLFAQTSRASDNLRRSQRNSA